MNSPANVSELVALAGVSNAGELSQARNRFFVLNLTFAALATTATTVVTDKNNASSAFVVDYIIGDVWLTNAATAIAGSPLLTDPSPTVGSNTHHPRNLVTVSFQLNDVSWSKSAVAWTNMIGSVREPAAPLFNPWIPPGSDIRCTVYNGSAVTISGEVALWGHYVRV